MSDEDIQMAQCGACNSIVPLNSDSCPECGVSFGGIGNEELGECGACNSIIPADSESCPNCGAVFVEPETNPETEVQDSTNLETTIEPELTPTPASEPEVQESAPMTATTPQQEEISNTPQVKEEETSVPEVEEETVVEETTSTPDQIVTEEQDEIHVEAPVEETVEAPVEDQDAETIEDTHEDATSVEEVSDVQPESEEPEEVSQEQDIEDMIDDLADELDDEQVATMEEAVDSEEEVQEEVEEPKPETKIEQGEVVMAFENLALAIAAKGMTAAEAFGEMDTSDDNLIDAPELQKGIERIAGEKLTPKHVTAILNYVDTDGNRRVDPNELVKALEDLRIGIQPGDIPKVKTFPSPAQKFLMGKKANDILYPIAYFLMVTFIGIWVVNGMGLIVDGTGGTIVYEGGTDQWGGEITEANWNLCDSDALDEMIDPCNGVVEVGDTYPCDPALDSNKCQNSLTPFSGDNGASSMPAGFYGDGIFMIILGVLGLAVIAYLHLVYAPSLRERAKKGTGQTTEEEIEDEEETEEESTDLLVAPVDLKVASEYDDESEDEDEDEEFEEDDDDELEEDDIDIGDWIGLEIDGDEYFGEIIEFNDKKGTVTIETEEGDEVTGDQDDMFLDDE